IESINFDAVKKAFDASANVYTASPDNLTPVPDSHHVVFKNLSEEERNHYWKEGLRAISRGEVAAIVLAGGQASRLGSSAPKGTIPLGLGVAPCDSLLGIQACKIALLEKLAKEEFPEAKETEQRFRGWCNDVETLTEKPQRNHFGGTNLPALQDYLFDQVTVFVQARNPGFRQRWQSSPFQQTHSRHCSK
ncbi:hypothetical protein OSTOST_19915, partial [Ostertagia ostertagi]